VLSLSPSSYSRLAPLLVPLLPLLFLAALARAQRALPLAAVLDGAVLPAGPRSAALLPPLPLRPPPAALRDGMLGDWRGGAAAAALAHATVTVQVLTYLLTYLQGLLTGLTYLLTN